jgi:2,5-furandicarboxylate decarboxylase 1
MQNQTERNMAKDLRSFLDDAQNADKLYRVSREADPHTQIGTLADESDRVLLFENVKNYEGWRVACNLNQNRDMEMVGLGVDKREDVVKKLSECIDLGPQPHIVVDSAPVQEIVWEGEEANLNRLPVVQHSELDGGTYIGSGVGVFVDPETGIHNTTWPRIQVGDGRTCGFLIYSPHVNRIAAKYAAQGQAMPMSVSIGHHPAIDIAASLSIHHPNCGELDYAGSIMGEQMEFVKCITNGIDVPASAEIIIEGEVPPGIVQDEGPFGNYMGTYSAGPVAKNGVQKAVVFKIKRITMRKKPIFRHLQSTVWTEHQRLCMLPIEANLYIALKEMGLDVHDVYIPTWGGCGLTVIQMTTRGPGEAQAAMLKATQWENTTLSFMSHTVVAVNRDVNIYDARDVMWALSVRTDWGKPVTQIFNTPASSMRAGAQRVKGMPYRLSGKAMIDATVLPPKDDFDWWDTNRAWPMGYGKYSLKDFVENYTPNEEPMIRQTSHDEMVAIKPGSFKPEIKTK